MFDEAGVLRRFIMVFVNGEDVRLLQKLDTPLKDGDEIIITPATGRPPACSSTVSVRPRSSVTLPGNTSSLLIRDSASWLPRIRNTWVPAACSRANCPTRNRAVVIEV